MLLKACRRAHAMHQHNCAETGLCAWAEASRCSAYLALRVPKLPCLPHSGQLDGRHVPLLVVQRVVGRGAGCICFHWEIRLAHRDLCMSFIAEDVSHAIGAHQERHAPSSQAFTHKPAYYGPTMLSVLVVHWKVAL